MRAQRNAEPKAVKFRLTEVLLICFRLLGVFVVTGIDSKLAAQDTAQTLRSEFLMELRADLDQQQQELGETPAGIRHIVYVKGGSFSGPKIKGEVLRGGGDWYLVRHDGVTQLDVRITLQTDDGALIFVTYRGIADISPKVRQRMSKGEMVDPSEYYFRTAPVFETASEKYSWLNRLIAVGIGKTTSGGVAYSIYAIK
ncbi:MAG TPA: DUF3237 domain-containing protein [Bryobacteraceae bacterium]|jgi:hypothetical protein|nr:DUF3237 domain-containing protein [Bryobacteraceae bacterium]